ncbi:hypothetical protein [Glaciecola sp. 1036]|uniref:hypothetical protein n=1 Tax=Alteromonadaceae TaxID=72275 RepID=UPI003D049100
MSLVATSSAFTDEILLLQDVTLANHRQQHKFTARNVELLSRHLIARHYNSLSWELAHLLWRVVNTRENAAIYNFFWIEEAVHSETAKSWFEDNQLNVLNQASSETLPNALQIVIHQHEFTLSWSRINILAALTEFMINLAPQIMDEIQQILWGKGLNAIRSCAGHIQKHLYQALEALLPPARAQQKLYFFEQQIQNIEPREVNLIFCDLWKKAKDIEGLTKLSNFYGQLCAYFQAKEADFSAESLDALEADEKISENIFAMLNQREESTHRLSSALNNVKVLSQAQWAKVELINTETRLSEDLFLALCSLWSFAPTQTKLIQAVRNNSSRETRLSLLDEMENYQQQVNFIQAMMKLNSQNALACLQLIKVHFPNKVVKALGTYSIWLETIEQKVSEAGSTQVASLEENPESLCPDIFEQAQSALKKNNRKGFTVSTLASIDDYMSTLQMLNILNISLRKILAKLQAFNGDNYTLETKYLADRCIIESEYYQRYFE